MLNTVTVQRILSQNGMLGIIQPPIRFNPFPHWFNGKYGHTLQNVDMPTLSQVISETATINTWHGFERFPWQMIRDDLGTNFDAMGFTCSGPGPEFCYRAWSVEDLLTAFKNAESMVSCRQCCKLVSVLVKDDGRCTRCVEASLMVHCTKTTQIDLVCCQ